TAFRSGPKMARGTMTRALLKSRSAASAGQPRKSRATKKHSFLAVFADPRIGHGATEAQRMKETNGIPLWLRASVAILRPDREGCMRCFLETPIITAETRRPQISFQKSSNFKF